MTTTSTTAPTFTFERITAADVRVGDVVGFTRNDVAEVAEREPNAASVWLRFEGQAGRIRPGLDRRMWRRVTEPAPEPLAPEVQALIDRRAAGTLAGGCAFSLAEVRRLEDAGLMTGYSKPNPPTPRGKTQRGYLFTEEGQRRLLAAQEARLDHLEGLRLAPNSHAMREVRALRAVLAAAGRLEG